MKKMKIRIGRDGKTTLQVEGAVGDECLEFTRAFEQALGAVENRVMCESEGTDETIYERERIEPAS